MTLTPFCHRDHMLWSASHLTEENSAMQFTGQCASMRYGSIPSTQHWTRWKAMPVSDL